MNTVTVKRLIKAGYVSFRRNGWLSTATVMVMVLVLFVMGSLIFLSAIAGTVLSSLETKVDVSVYFLSDAPEDSILAVKREIEKLPEIAEVTYTSREKALAEFREKHKGNALIADALTEIGENPLEATLNIRAKDPTQYGAISEYLQKKNYPTVHEINYFENQKVIERLASILATARGSGAVLALFLAFVAILVAFNTVRLVIYTMRDEIGIMRLVGATPWFIRGPFLVAGMLYGGIAALLTMLTFFPLTWFAAPKLAVLVPGFDIFQYFLQNFVEFAAILLGMGVFLGIASSFIAIRRYLDA